MKRIFVYGSLKRGMTNHHYLAGQRFLGEARTAPGYHLYDAGGYPGMVPEAGGRLSVTGEVWEIDDTCLKHVDKLEGLSLRLYSRETIPVQNPFEHDEIEAYLYLRPTDRLRDVGDTWIED